MIIVMPDEEKFDLDKQFNINKRIELVTNICNKYRKHFNDYWEDKKNTNGKYNHKTKTTLDILGGYIYLATEYDDVLSDRQMEYRTNNIELPFGLNEKDADFIRNFQESTRKNNIKKSIKKYQKSKTHKLTTIKIPKELRKNMNYASEDCYEYYFSTDDGTKSGNLVLEKKYPKETFIINTFIKDDKKLPFIDPSLPYIYEWCIVSKNGEFEFDGDKYKIDLEKELQYSSKITEEYADKYNKNCFGMDKILVYFQEGNYYFLDMNIDVINNEYIKKSPVKE